MNNCQPPPLAESPTVAPDATAIHALERAVIAAGNLVHDDTLLELAHGDGFVASWARVELKRRAAIVALMLGEPEPSFHGSGGVD